MAIKPRQDVYWTCVSCGWQREASKGSDMLLPKPRQCGKCGSQNLELKQGNMLSGLFKMFSGKR